MARAITFPMTRPGVRTNRETGVEILTVSNIIDGKGYVVYAPDLNSPNGEVRVGRLTSLADAREVAADRVRFIRGQAAAAYTEALTIDDSMTQARLRQASAWGLRHMVARFDASDMPAMIDADHADALTEDIARVVRAACESERPARRYYAARAASLGLHPVMTPSPVMTTVIDSLHAEALTEDAARTAIDQTSAWLTRHGVTIMTPNTESELINADHAEALTANQTTDIDRAVQVQRWRLARNLSGPARTDAARVDADHDAALTEDAHRTLRAELAAERHADATAEAEAQAGIPAELAEFHGQVADWHTRHGITAPYNYGQVVAARDADHAAALAEDARRAASASIVAAVNGPRVAPAPATRIDPRAVTQRVAWRRAVVARQEAMNLPVWPKPAAADVYAAARQSLIDDAHAEAIAEDQAAASAARILAARDAEYARRRAVVASQRCPLCRRALRTVAAVVAPQLNRRNAGRGADPVIGHSGMPHAGDVEGNPEVPGWV